MAERGKKWKRHKEERDIKRGKKEERKRKGLVNNQSFTLFKN